MALADGEAAADGVGDHDRRGSDAECAPSLQLTLPLGTWRHELTIRAWTSVEERLLVYVCESILIAIR